MSEGHDNKILFQKCHKVLVIDTTDVQFIFEDGDDVVKVPARKSVLAALSPVFNAMFNGELKEKSDVTITDATPEAFREFLQFFYDPQVNLTMDNIASVLKLVDKYDIADSLPVCVGFLMENAKINDILLALHLAIRYNLDDLKTFCEQKIVQNPESVFDMINFEGGRLQVASDNRLTDVELEALFPYLFTASKNVISNMAKKIKSAILPITLSGHGNGYSYVDRIEPIQFSINETMWLDDIIYSEVYFQKRSALNIQTLMVKLSIDEKPNSNGRTQSIFTRDIVIQHDLSGRNRIEIQSPLKIIANYIYTITFKADHIPYGLVSPTTTIPEKTIELAPGVIISFPQENHKHVHSLVSRLYFKFP